METESNKGFLRRPSYLWGAAYYLGISLAIIVFGSPLFRVLGFEYSGFVSLFASVHILFYASLEARRGESLKDLAGRISIFCTIPLLVSLVSAIFIPNCSLWDGVVFYAEIVYPTVLIAALCGVRFGSIKRSQQKTNIYLSLFWLGSILLSLLPGYFSARIYSYGWQYGFFPGFVWDEVMELRSEYWISRIVEIAAISTWIIYEQRTRLEKAKKPIERKRTIFLWEYWVLTCSAAAYGIFYFFQFSDFDLQRYLTDSLRISKNVQLHFVPASLAHDEIVLHSYEIRKDIGEIDSIYGIREPAKIDIYIFPNADDLYRYIGTREASITKPWKRSIYITKQNLQSLKHEMAHAILSSYGSFPFDMSWSTGLTEGAAVAIEENYDGIRSVSELSDRILQLKLSPGVSDVMQVSGFLSAAPSTSYVLSGSFSQFLLQSYGGTKYLKVYKDREFDETYGKSLAGLEADWKERLKKSETPMDHYDSLRTLYYFKRTSILRQPCIRRIGKLIKRADEIFRSKNYKLADSLYDLVMGESGSLRSVRGRVLSQLHLNNPSAALAILDTTGSANEPQTLSALRLLRGDMITLATGDLKKAAAEWEEAMKLELGDGYFQASFMRLNFFAPTTNISAVQKILFDLYGVNESKDKIGLVFAVDPDSTSDCSAFYKARLWLYTSYSERNGRLQDGYKLWLDGLHKIEDRFIVPNEVTGEELFDRLIQKKYANYPTAFSNHPWEIRTLP